MRIEKIELIGFKSFSERTAFNLHPGITCIVGPNGCGKSNVVDAFRWALGEQSAKSLRSDKMKEVIFSGTSTKKPKGVAEVTLVVSGIGDPTQDNGDDPQNFTSVTRRLYRSGESEYMANKSVCRLKDIKDLFLDSGLEVKSYSILEQDRIAAVLNSKPQDRRFIIEEVAGVMKYKVRKTEAQNKLEVSRLNLQRINDIVTEVKRQINALDRQAKKAERYKKLSAEIRTIELKIAKRDYQTLRESLERILAEYTVLKENEAMKKAELTKVENISETNRLGIFEKEKALEIIQQEFRDAEKAIAETERVIAVLNTDRDNLKEYLAKLFAQREEFGTKEKELSEKLGELGGTDARLSGDMEGLKEELRLKNELIESVENELSEKESSVDSKRRNVFRASEELSALRNETGRMQVSLEALERKEVSLIKDAEDSKKFLNEINLSIRDAEGSLRDRNSEVLLLSEKKSVYTLEAASLKEKIEYLRDELSKTKEDLASNISRMGSLKELVLDAPTREILQDGPNLHIVSSLSDILNVEPEYEKAVENALSEKINSFILKSLADIEIAISTLKSKGSGRMSFIPLDSRTFDELSDVPAGIIGRAVDFVKIDAEFAGVARNLLRNIFIVKDLRTAIALRESGNNYFFVTLNGEIVEPSGAVIGGEGRGVLKRKRELREIEELIGQKTDSISMLQEDINRLQHELSDKESGIRDIEAAVVNAEKEMSLSKFSSANYQEEKERTDRKLTYLSIEVEDIIREKESLKNMITEEEKTVNAGEAEKSAVEKDMAALLEEIIQKKMRYEEDRSHITDIRLSITAYKEKIEAVQKEIETTGNAMEELSQKDNSLNGEIKSVEERISQREAESGENEEKIKGMILNADRLRDDISVRKEALEQENQQMLSYEQAVKALRHEIDALTSKVSSLDVERAEHRLKIENLAENIRQNYGAEIDSIETEPILPEDEERLTELGAKIQELGPVNLGTLEEYEELTTRYEFLSKQQGDLNRSIAELEEAITKINSTTRKKLREAFEALKIKFSEVFISLFGGGRAELILTDENNILETGIDIIAQPPGKKLQNITLLSGGEKALTALSLLFASFLIKPTPLCILDEADAPLDDSNTGRFSRMLRELSSNIQFIVLTHNRVTMEASDYIYGITMEEPGVSKVISMQLAEA